MAPRRRSMSRTSHRGGGGGGVDGLASVHENDGGSNSDDSDDESDSVGKSLAVMFFWCVNFFSYKFICIF
jgi:hypothetical protein